LAPPPSAPPAVRLLVLTDRAQAAAAGHDLVEVLSAAVEAGATAVVLREKDLPAGDRAALARRLRGVTAGAGAALIVAGDVGLAAAVGADGAHLAADDPWPGRAAGRGLWGRSCHTLAEVRRAAAEGVDYVTYSPVFATGSKPGYGPAVGLDGLAAARRAADPAVREAGAAGSATVAVVALGGIGPGRAQACLRAGADGVAVMGEVMRADDPGAVVRALAAEMTETRTAGGARG
jgi:thiamine-phosphate pyrophosphorylase